MCVSATVSFSLSGLLVAGGGLCLYKAHQIDRKYIPMSLFPVIVGIQQAAEGYVWTGFSMNDQASINLWAMVYLFFTWMVWPVWVPFMTATLEPDHKRKRQLSSFVTAGFILGVALYIPNFWHPEWLEVSAVRNSIVYNCTFMTESLFPRWAAYLLYLFLIGLPPLLSSHLFVRVFGASLIAAIPLTYFFFSYAHVSVLCFFAALITTYLIYVIATDKCRVHSSRLLNG